MVYILINFQKEVICGKVPENSFVDQLPTDLESGATPQPIVVRVDCNGRPNGDTLVLHQTKQERLQVSEVEAIGELDDRKY